MDTYLDELKQRMTMLNDDSLIKIITTDINDYEPEAIEIAKEELMNRGICVDELITSNQLDHKADIQKDSTIKAQAENQSDDLGYVQNNLYKATEPKISWSLKQVFKNYKALALILALGFIIQFFGIKKYTLSIVIHDLYIIIITHIDTLTTVSALLRIIFQLLIYIALTISMLSGILLMYGKAVKHETSNIYDFVKGIAKYWKGVLFAGLCLTPTLGILKEILQGLIFRAYPPEGLVITFIKSSIALSITYLYMSILVYGSLIMIETGVKIKQFPRVILRFIFSRKVVKLFLALLFAGLIFQPINILRYHYLISSNLFATGSLFSIIDVVTKPRVPLWVDILETLANTVIMSFVLLHTSILFHSSFKSSTSSTTNVFSNEKR